MKRVLTSAVKLTAVALTSMTAMTSQVANAYDGILEIKGTILPQTCAVVGSSLKYTLPTAVAGSLSAAPGAAVPIDIRLRNCPNNVSNKHETTAFRVKTVFTNDANSIDADTGLLLTHPASGGAYDIFYPRIEILNHDTGARIDLRTNSNLPTALLAQKPDSSDIVLSYYARFWGGPGVTVQPLGDVATSLTFTIAYE